MYLLPSQLFPPPAPRRRAPRAATTATSPIARAREILLRSPSRRSRARKAEVERSPAA